MNVDARDIEVLQELQQVDIEIMKARKQRADLPQRAKLEALEAKQRELAAKFDQVEKLRAKSQGELDKVEAEDSGLADKQRRAQELIDAAGSDYRSIESHSKELSGFAKRRDTLSEKIDALAAQLKKISDLHAQLDQALQVVERERLAASESLDQADSSLIESIGALQSQRGQLVSGLPSDLVDLYDKTAARTGGVALGQLNDATCGVCRSVIDGGRLIELRASAPLGVCPSCKRLLVI